MKYTAEVAQQILTLYQTDGVSVPQIAQIISEQLGQPVPERSLIAKLTSMGVYKKKVYTTKTGDAPIRKEVYLEKISQLIGIDLDSLESLAKSNKPILAALVRELEITRTCASCGIAVDSGLSASSNCVQH